MPAQPSKADLRRAAILQAAMTLLVDKGLPDSSIDDIAAQAGVAKGTFYHYFASRADLLAALGEQFNDAFKARVVAAVDARAADDWNGRFETWIIAATEAYFDMHALHDLVFHGPAMPHRHAMGDVDVVRHLADLLAAGQAAGAWSLGVSDPLRFAVLIFHGLHGTVDDVLATGQSGEGTGPLLAQLSRRLLAG